MSMNPDDFKRNQESHAPQVLFSKNKKNKNRRFAVQGNQEVNPGEQNPLAAMDASQGVGSAAPVVPAPVINADGLGLAAPVAAPAPLIVPAPLIMAAPAPLIMPAPAPLAIPAPEAASLGLEPSIEADHEAFTTEADHEAFTTEADHEAFTTPAARTTNPNVITQIPSEFSIVNSAEEKRSAEKREERGVKRGRGQANLNDGSTNPLPNKFIFEVDRFPFYVKLPVNLFIKEGSATRTLTEDEIVVFFDDVLMPFKIIDNKVVVQINENPFQKLHRPDVYDKLDMLISVYVKKECIRKAGLDLHNGQSQSQSQSNNQSQSKSQQSAPLDTLQELQKGRIYKGQFTYFMSAEIGHNLENHSDNDSDQEYYRGVVAKKRFNVPEVLKLCMMPKAQAALYTLLQSYLRGGFFLGDPQNINENARERSSRNATFTSTMRRGNTKVAREWIAAMLIEIAKYYSQNCNKDPDFRNGIIQLLDFAHGLGSIGAEAFRFIIHMENSPFAKRNNMMSFRFPRIVEGTPQIVRLMVAPNGQMGEVLEGAKEQAEMLAIVNQKNNSNVQDQDTFMADFEKSFANLNLSREDAQAAASGMIAPDVEMQDASLDEPVEEQPGQGQADEQEEEQDDNASRGAPAHKRRRI